MRKDYYLPELHDFEHVATAHWPIVLCDDQLDWVQSVDTMEAWLNRFVGHHYSYWAYHNGTSMDYWLACIAFKRARDKTLFLLTWS
jgi:hypothetical protein